jgi:hypothetical protein
MVEFSIINPFYWASVISQRAGSSLRSLSEEPVPGLLGNVGTMGPLVLYRNAAVFSQTRFNLKKYSRFF